MERNPNIILKEQWQLVRAQKEMDKMIKLINGCLNEFLVENLQLKSNEVSKLIKDTENEMPAKPSVDQNLSEDNEINKQSLNLNMANTVKSEYVEEEDDEDEEIETLAFL